MEGREEEQKPSLGDSWKIIQGRNSWGGLLDPFDPNLKSEVLRYGDFANACYAVVDNDRSQRESLLLQDSENLRNCGYEITEPLFSSAQSLMSYMIGDLKMKTFWVGFIAVCNDENEIRRLGRRDIVVAFRGTKKRREWFQNLKYNLVPWLDLPGTNSNPDVQVCEAFLEYYTDTDESVSKCSLRDTVKREISRLLKMYEGQELSITLTGHSLGAAFATLSAYDIGLMCRPMLVTVFAFSSPRVGNPSFTSRMKKIGVKVLQLKIKGDVVPKLPIGRPRFSKKEKSNYCHVGTVISLNPNSSGLSLCMLDLTGRHDLGNLLYLIDGFQGSKQEFKKKQKKKKGSKQEFKSSRRGEKYIAK